MKSLLKLEDVRPELKITMNKGLSVFCIRDVINDPEYYNIDYDVYLYTKGLNLQRPFVWDKFQKQELILSILKGINIPPMSIVQFTQVIGNHSSDRKQRVYEIIDGKQRLSTIVSFAKGEFSIRFEGKEYFIDDLEDKAQREILNYWVKADVAYSYDYGDGDLSAFITDEEKVQWFEMLNFSGTPQDIEHLNKIKHKIV